MAATPPLAESLALAKARGNDPQSCGFELCRNILLGVKEARCHRPDLCLKYGGYLLQSHRSSMSHEVWAAYEQVYVALLQRGRYEAKRAPSDAASGDDMRQAQEFLSVLSSQFPDSLRVKRLEAMMWEAKRDTELAVMDYDAIVADDPSNLLALKRQVAIFRSRGKLADAAKRLNDYLNTFCSDGDAWLMLSEIYLQCQQYRRAAFCVEELILTNPMSYIYHLRAGEITYTQGMSDRGGSNELLLTARKYFAHALELKPENNLRALYGMLLTCSALGNVTKAKGAKVDTADLVAFISPLLTKCYTPAGAPPHPMRALVLSLVKKLTAGLPTSAGA